MSEETPDVFDTIWEDDLLDRRKDAEFLIHFLTRRVQEREEEGKKRSYVLNLDAPWGVGKTFFMTRLKKHLEEEDYLVCYVNAWEDDHAVDPLISVISSVEELMKNHLEKKPIKAIWEKTKSSALDIVVTTGKHLALDLIKRKTGEGFDEIMAAAEGVDDNQDDDTELKGHFDNGIDKLGDRIGDKLLKTFRQSKSSIDTFKKNLGLLIGEVNKSGKKKAPLFILVDELDRCRPTYAIEMLERVKHLFDVDDVVFIFATDRTQLQHSIKVIYGEGFEARRYLLRFFDRIYLFKEPNLEEFVEQLFQQHKINDELVSCPFDQDKTEFFVSAMKFHGLNPRDAEQCFDLLRTVATGWAHPLKLEFIYLLPLIIAFQRDDGASFKILADGAVTGVFPGIKWIQVYNLRIMVDTFNSREEATKVDIYGLLAKVLQSTEIELSEVVNREAKIQQEHWVQNIFRAEVKFLSNHFNKSVMLTYPELVQNAGRLSENSGTLDES